MPFFPQAYLSPQPTLFDILSALDEPHGKSCARVVRRHAPQQFTPKFDVTETVDAYELYGEVPGLQQENLSIEFSDAQTLVVKGKTNRVAKPAETTPASEAETSDSASEKSHNATVEDDYDEADTPLATPASTVIATATEEKKPEEQAQTPRPKYWVAERRVGEFARSFSFEQRIEQDFVHAQLKDGLLVVVVPKSQKSRKVNVTVA